MKLTSGVKNDGGVTKKQLNIGIALCWVLPFTAMSSSFFDEKMFGLSNVVITLGTLISLPILYVFIYRYCKNTRKQIVNLQTGSNTERNKTKANTKTGNMSTGVVQKLDEEVASDVEKSAQVVQKDEKGGLKVVSLVEKSAPGSLLGDKKQCQEDSKSMSSSLESQTEAVGHQKPEISIVKSTTKADTAKTVVELQEKKRQLKMVRKILVLMSTYFMCSVIFVPVGILRDRLPYSVFLIVKAIFLGNSVFNPVIYILANARFRAVLKKMLGLGNKDKKNDSPKTQA